MKIESNVKATGSLKIQVIDSQGNLKEERNIDNLVVTTGKNYIASRMVGTASTVMSHMAVGTDDTSPAAGDTALIAEAGRVALSSFTASTNSVTATATFPAGTGTGALVEAGILNASSGGTMLCRTTFSVVNKAAGDSVAITWTITVS
jgi:hypothetical protein